MFRLINQLVKYIEVCNTLTKHFIIKLWFSVAYFEKILIKVEIFKWRVWVLQSGIRAPLSSDCVGYVSIRAGLCIQTEWASCVSRVCLWIMKCLFYGFTWCVYSWTISVVNWIKWSILLLSNYVNVILLCL